jgi:hypothetical protein
MRRIRPELVYCATQEEEEEEEGSNKIHEMLYDKRSSENNEIVRRKI